MEEDIRKAGRPHDGRLGTLIHEAVRRAIEHAVEEELMAALGAARYGHRAHHPARAGTAGTDEELCDSPGARPVVPTMALLGA